VKPFTKAETEPSARGGGTTIREGRRIPPIPLFKENAGAVFLHS